LGRFFCSTRALAQQNWCVAASKFEARQATLFYREALLILFGRENMTSTIAILLLAWLGSNAAFVALRFYVGADRSAHAKQDFDGYPRLVR
jgi:hypothetical protein